MVLFLLNALKCFTQKKKSFNNYVKKGKRKVQGVSQSQTAVSLRNIWSRLGNRVATFLGKGYQFCLLSVLFMAVQLYFAVFPLV